MTVPSIAVSVEFQRCTAERKERRSNAPSAWGLSRPNMGLLAKLQEDLKIALKGGNSEVAGTIRMLQAAIHNEHIAKGKEKEFTDEDIMAVLRKEAKKRRESADIFASAGRAELASKEEGELTLIKGYLPPELSDAEVDALVAEVIAAGGSEFGKVMGAVMAKVAGRAESGRVSAAVKKALGE